MPITPPPARGALCLAYFLLACAGFAALIWPAPSVGAAGRYVADTWALFLIVGSVPSLIAVFRRSWFGEWVGLILLCTVWLVYGGAVGWSAAAHHRPQSWPACLALLSIAGLMAARWTLVDLHRRGAVAVAHRDADEYRHPPGTG